MAIEEVCLHWVIKATSENIGGLIVEILVNIDCLKYYDSFILPRNFNSRNSPSHMT